MFPRSPLFVLVVELLRECGCGSDGDETKMELWVYRRRDSQMSVARWTKVERFRGNLCRNKLVAGIFGKVPDTEQEEKPLV